MRIEVLNNNSKGLFTVSGFQTDFNVLLTESDSVIKSLDALKNYSNFMNGGIGGLQRAFENINFSLEVEHQKYAALQNVQRKCSDFCSFTVETDNKIACLVSQNEEKFYMVNLWAKPLFFDDTITRWHNEAKTWMQGALNFAEKIEYSLSVYLHSNFSKYSAEELDKYINDLIDKENEGTMTKEDKIRLNALYQYVSINATSKNKKCYLRYRTDIHALLYPLEMQEINECIDKNNDLLSEDEELQVKYYMTYGTDYETARDLYSFKRRPNNTYGDVSMICATKRGCACTKQGNFHIDNMTISQNMDGTSVFSCDARQSSAASSYGALIVYDGHGKIEEVKVLERYQNPNDLKSAVKTIYKDLKGENYVETKVNVIIPKGGYIQITDDPDEIDLIQMGKGLEEIAVDKVKDEVKGEVKDALKRITGIGQVGKHATDAVKWKAESMNRAKHAYEIVKTTAKISDRISNVFWSEQERGTGSLIIYNS